MRDDELKSFLREMNPWWRAAATGGDRTEWATLDRSLRDRSKYDLGYRSSVLLDLVTEPIEDGLYVIRGPRRVGKSVALKDFILLLSTRKDLSPWQITYIPADTFAARDLRRAIALATDMAHSAPDSRHVWIFDEITAVDGWAAEIKSRRDNSVFGEQTVILTGSSASSAEQSVRDLGAGRTGVTHNPFRMLLPMSFRDFVTSVSADISLPKKVAAWDIQSTTTAVAVRELEVFNDELDLLWQRYLETGGFPRAVAEHYRNGAVSQNFLLDIASWLSADVDPGAASDSVPLLLDELHIRGSSPLNIRETANQLSISRDFLTTRLNRLVSTFAALWCPKVDNLGRRILGAQAKFYLADPMLAWLGPRLRPGLADPNFTRLTEAALGTSLARALDHASPGRLTSADTIGYTRTDSGKEIDFAPVPFATAAGDRQTVPLESKWVSDGWRAESRVITGKFNAGIIATKNITDLSSRVWAIPAPVLALLLE